MDSAGSGGATEPVRAGSVRRFSLSVGQLASAAVLVALVSAATVFYAMGGDGGAARLADTDAQSSEGATRPVMAGAAARAVAVEMEQYGEMIGQLEQVLADGHDLLAPETLATIEQSLRTVEEAIAEVESALAEDPNSDLLRRLLTTHQRTKLGVLQRAAAAVQAQT